MDKGVEKGGTSWTAREWAEWFRDAYRDVLRETPESLTGEGKYWLKDAQDVFGGLTDEAKALLSEERRILEHLGGGRGKKAVEDAVGKAS